jgi:hypothetical protein
VKPVTITLPTLSTAQALALCDALQDVLDAIWDVHGTAMAEILARDAMLEPADDELDPAEDDVPL